MEIQSTKPRQFPGLALDFIVLLRRWLGCRTAGRRLMGTNALPDGFFGVTVPQGFQPDKPLLFQCSEARKIGGLGFVALSSMGLFIFLINDLRPPFPQKAQCEGAPQTLYLLTPN